MIIQNILTQRIRKLEDRFEEQLDNIFTYISLKEIYFPNYVYIKMNFDSVNSTKNTSILSKDKDNNKFFYINEAKYEIKQNNFSLIMEQGKVNATLYTTEEIPIKVIYNEKNDKKFISFIFNKSEDYEFHINNPTYIYFSSQDHLLKHSNFYAIFLFIFGLIIACYGYIHLKIVLCLYNGLIIFSFVEILLEFLNPIVKMEESLNLFILLGSLILSIFISLIFYDFKNFRYFIEGLLFGIIIIKILFYFIFGKIMIRGSIAYIIYILFSILFGVFIGLMFIFIEKFAFSLRKFAYLIVGSYYIIFACSLVLGGFYYDVVFFIFEDTKWATNTFYSNTIWIYRIQFILTALLTYIYSYFINQYGIAGTKTSKLNYKKNQKPNMVDSREEQNNIILSYGKTNDLTEGLSGDILALSGEGSGRKSDSYEM